MTISNPLSQVTILGNGATTTFQFPFVGVAAQYIVVTYTNAAGVQTVLSSSQYSVTLNPVLTGQLWPVGGTVTYPLTGPPIANGTSLTIARVLPLTQLTSIANQGDFSPEVIEGMGDTLCMELQQIVAGSGTSTAPNFYYCGTVTGTPNALVVNSTTPPNFSLNECVIVFVPTQFNTGSATIDILGTGNVLLQKPSWTGLANLIEGDLPPGLPVLASYNGSVFICDFGLTGYETTVSTNQNITIANGFTPYTVTSSCTFTFAQSTTLASFWYIDILALSGVVVTIVINAADKINNGSLGVGITMPAGSSGRLTTDANGNLFLNGTAGNVSGVTPGSYTNPTITVNSQGFVTSVASSGTSNVTVYNSAIAGCLPSSITGSSTSASMTIGSGQATDSTNAAILNSAGYSWAVSNGNAINGYSGGTSIPSNSITVHMYLCKGSTGTGTFASPSYSGSNVTFPVGYNSFYRRIFSFNTNTTGSPVPYKAIETEGGSLLAWLATQVLDNSGTISTTPAAIQLNYVPGGGIKVQPIGRFDGPTGGQSIIFTSGDETNIAPASGTGSWTVAPGFDFGSSSTLQNGGMNGTLLTTNTSGQIVICGNGASIPFYWVTRGFKDWRRS